jgi:hypothetical protein
MKGTLVAIIALTVGLTFPAAAQQQDTQEVTKAIKALSTQESEMIQKKDAAGIASRFTSDGLLASDARTEADDKAGL